MVEAQTGRIGPDQPDTDPLRRGDVPTYCFPKATQTELYPIADAIVQTTAVVMPLVEAGVAPRVPAGRTGTVVTRTRSGGFAGMTSNAINKSISAEQHALLRQLFNGGSGKGLGCESIEAAAELSRRALNNPATSQPQRAKHLDRLRQLNGAKKRL